MLMNKGALQVAVPLLKNHDNDTVELALNFCHLMLTNVKKVFLTVLKLVYVFIFIFSILISSMFIVKFLFFNNFKTATVCTILILILLSLIIVYIVLSLYN